MTPRVDFASFKAYMAARATGATDAECTRAANDFTKTTGRAHLGRAMGSVARSILSAEAIREEELDSAYDELGAADVAEPARRCLKALRTKVLSKIDQVGQELMVALGETSEVNASVQAKKAKLQRSFQELKAIMGETPTATKVQTTVEQGGATACGNISKESHGAQAQQRELLRKKEAVARETEEVKQSRPPTLRERVEVIQVSLRISREELEGIRREFQEGRPR